MNAASKQTNFALRSLISVVFVLNLLMMSCSLSTAVQPAEATKAPTDTPQPTSTATASPVPTETATMTPSPTFTSTPDETATVAAIQTSTAVALNEAIKPELEKVGALEDEGHLVWSNPRPVTLQTGTYGEIRYHGLDDLKSASDFILHTKITWNTTTGFAGCGLVFRGEEDFENGAHYYFIMVRVKYAPYWIITYDKFNRAEYPLAGGPVFTSAINDDNDSTNDVFLVVKGQNILSYINGKKQQLAEDVKLKDGKIAFSAIQESGTTKCTFEDSWVWAYNEKDK